MNEMYKKLVMKIMMMQNIKMEILFEVNSFLYYRFSTYKFHFFYLACVTYVDIHKEEIQVTVDSSTNRMFIKNLFFSFLDFIQF